jgi:RNA polymerase sigma-70 factor (ECF subfamily)
MTNSVPTSPPPRRANLSAERELQLLRGIARKDREAFEELYYAYYPRLFQYIYKLTRRPELVEEVLDDVMFVVWRSASKFAAHSRVSTWIFGIAYRKGLKALEQRSRWLGKDETARATEGVVPAVAETRLMREQLAATIESALSSLSPEQRGVVELTFFHERSYSEIAEITGCPVNTVKTRMFHAKRRLRAVLGDEESV